MYADCEKASSYVYTIAKKKKKKKIFITNYSLTICLDQGGSTFVLEFCLFSIFAT